MAGAVDVLTKPSQTGMKPLERDAGELRSRVAPFTSWQRFVQRQNRDFRFGATVTTAQANTLAAQLRGGSVSPTAYIDLLAHGVFDDTYAPAARPIV